MRLAAAQGQGGAVVGTGADGGAACQVDTEGAVGHADLAGGQVAVGVGHAQAADGQGGVFGHALRAGHGVDGRGVARTNDDVEGVAGAQAANVGGGDFDADGARSGRRTGDGACGCVKAQALGGQGRAVGQGGRVDQCAVVHVAEGVGGNLVIDVGAHGASGVGNDVGHDGRVVGTVDGHGDGGGAGQATGVFDGVGEHVWQCGAAHVQGLHGGVVLVHGVAVAAVGTDFEGAVGACHGGAVGAVAACGHAAGGAAGAFGDGADHQGAVGVVHVGVVGQHFADDAVDAGVDACRGVERAARFGGGGAVGHGHGGVVDGRDGDGDFVCVLRALGVGGDDGEFVRAVEVAGPGVVDAGQCGVDLHLGAAQGHRGAVVGTSGDGGTTRQGDVQVAVEHADLCGGQVAVSIRHADAGDGLLGVFGHGLGGGHGVERRGVENHGVVLQCAGRCATSAGDAGFDLRVAVSDQVCTRNEDAEGAVCQHCAGQGCAFDCQSDGVACGELARHFAGHGDVACRFGAVDDVVSRHRVQADGRELASSVAVFDHVVLCGFCRLLGRAAGHGGGDAGFDSGVGVGLEVGSGDSNAVHTGCVDGAAELDVVHGQGDHVARCKRTGGFTGERGAGDSAFGGVDDVVARDRVQRQSGLERFGVGVQGERTWGGREGGAVVGAVAGQDFGRDGFVAAVEVGHKLCPGHARNAVLARRVHRAGVVGAAHVDGDFVACAEFARDRAGDGDVAALLGGAQEVVAGDGVDDDDGACRRRGVDRVVLQGAGFAAPGAGNAAFDLRVGVCHQVGCGHVDAEFAVCTHGAGHLCAFDREGDGVARCKLARDQTGDGDGAGVFCGVDDVVGCDRVNAQGGDFANVGTVFHHIVLRGGGRLFGGAARHGGGDAGFGLAVGVGFEVGGADVDAVVACSVDGARVGFDAVCQTQTDGDHVTGCKCACGFAREGGAGGGAFGSVDDVVARDGLERERGFEGLGVAVHRVGAGHSGDGEGVARVVAGQDAGVDFAVGVGGKLAAVNACDGVLACRIHRAGVVSAAHVDGDFVTCTEFAGDRAGDGDGAGLLGGRDKVVAGDGVDGDHGAHRRGDVDRVFLDRIGQRAAGASDAGFDGGVAVSDQVGCRHVDAEESLGVDGARVRFVHTTHHEHEGDGVAGGKLARDFAGDGNGAGVFCGVDDVVGRHRVQADGRELAHGGAVFDHVVLCSFGRLFGSARHAGDGGGNARFNAGVGVGLEVGGVDGDAVVACRVHGARVGFDFAGQPQADGDHVTGCERASGFAREGSQGVGAFGRVNDVVNGHGVERQSGFERFGVGVERVGTQRRGVDGGVVGAVTGQHGGQHFFVGIRCQLAARNAQDAVLARGVHGRAVTRAVHGEGDDVACAEVARDGAGDGDAASLLRGVQEVVAGDGVDADGALRHHGVHRIVLNRIGQRATGASDARFDGGVAVSDQVGCRHVDAEFAVCTHSAGVRLVHTAHLEREGDGVTRCKGTRDFAGDGNVAGVFCSVDDVVSGDGVDADGRELAYGGAGFDHVVLRSFCGLLGSAAGHGGRNAGFDSGVGVGLEVGSGHSDAVHTGCVHGAAELDVVHRQGDHVACCKRTCGFARQGGAGDSAFGRVDDVVACHGVQGQSGLERFGVGVQGEWTWGGRDGGGVAGRVAGQDAGRDGFVAGVEVSHQLGARHAGHTVFSGGVDSGAVVGAVHRHGDDVARFELARDSARDGDAASRFAGRDEVVAGDGVNRERGARWGRRCGVDGVVLQGAGRCAAGAGDAALDLRVAVGQQLRRGHVDAVVARGVHGSAVGQGVDRHGDDVAAGELARHFAGDGGGAAIGRAVGQVDEVVARDGGNGQRRLCEGARAFHGVVLRGISGFLEAVNGGCNARLYLRVGVRDQVGCGHSQAVGARGVHSNAVGFAAAWQPQGDGDDVTHRKRARHFARERGAGSGAFGQGDDVVAGDGVQRQGRFGGLGAGVHRVGAGRGAEGGAVGRAVGGQDLGFDLLVGVWAELDAVYA